MAVARQGVRTRRPEVAGRDGLLHEAADPRDVLASRAELRSALDALAAVPARRREVKVLQITGLSYEEIGERLGLSYTRVNHLLTEANRAIRRERDRSSPDRPPLPPRGQRLWEHEQQPPNWLTAAVGRPPGKLIPAEVVLSWRRAALAIDDYRREHGAHLGDEPLGEPPTDSRAARSYDLAARAITRAREAREAMQRRSLER